MCGGGVLMSSHHRSRIREVEGLELGLLDGEVWDRKVSRNSWQGEFEEQSDAPARTISAALLSFQASQDNVRSETSDLQKPGSLDRF